MVALLIDTSELLADTRNEPESVEYQRAAERAEILQRDWGAKVRVHECVQHLSHAVLYTNYCTGYCGHKEKRVPVRNE